MWKCPRFFPRHAFGLVRFINLDMETGIPAPIDPVSESTFPQQVALILKGNSELDSCLIPLSERVSDIQEEIVTVSRRNFKLEREVDELDERIKLLIKNKASSVSDKVDVKDDGNVTSDPPLKQTRSHYEHLLFALQEDPCYFARMARIVKGKEVNPFVLLVVLDMYGDQYDTREERLLLQLFELVLREEFESTENIGSLMRHNNATTQMLSAYARRGQGLAVLKTALHGPLTSILTGTVLDLELNPIKIHAQIVADYESTTGLVWDGELQPDHETAVSTPEVMKLVSERIGILEDLCQLVLDSIIGAMDEIPYGMRWVCRKLQQLAVEYFGALNNSVLGSIVGGYIFLRFFTPMIVTPDALKLVNLQANRTQRRTLVLIAKVLQACSNGTLFGDKEVYMVGMNNFIQTNRPRLIEFFGQLTDIDEFHHFVQVDKYIANTMLRSPFISTTLNQLFLVDSLIESNLDLICPNDDDKVRQIMSELRESSPGSPIPVAPSDNSVVRVELVDRFLYDKRFSMTSSPNEIDSFLLNSHHFEVAQDMIRSLLNIAPIDIVDSSMSLADLLDRCRIYGEEHESIDMLDCINDILYALRGITKMSMERAALALNHEVIFQSFAEVCYTLGTFTNC